MVIALDIGTSSARASIYDGAGRLVEGRFHQIPCQPRVTPDGGVEHDARALFDAVVTCLDAVQAGRRSRSPASASAPSGTACSASMNGGGR